MAAGGSSAEEDRARLPTRESFRLVGHRDKIVSLLAHPFLPLLVSSSDDGTVRVWDLESRALLCALEELAIPTWGLAFDPAGRRLATGSDDFILRLWDLDSGACVSTLAGHSGDVWAAVWEPSGELVASGSWDNTIRLWYADSGALRRTLEGHESYIYALAAHPSDDLLASGSHDCTVRVWRWSSGALVWASEGLEDAVCSLVASASWLVSGLSDKSVRVWSWGSGACMRVLDGFTGSLWQNSLSWRDSTFVTLDEKTARVWDASSADPSDWSCVGSLPSRTSSACGVAALGSSCVACAAPGDITTVAVWSVE